MSSQEIKAFIHRNRIADVVNALFGAGFNKLTIIDVTGVLPALDTKEQGYSVELGQMVITEAKLELVCENETKTAEAIEIIRKHARTGQPHAGWIYVSPVSNVIEIAD